MLSPTAALLVIDMQQGFDDPCWGPRNNPDTERNVARLIDAWRRTRRPIHHVHHASPAPNGCFRPNTRGHAPKPEAQPVPGEAVHVKAVNSAFIGTRLEADLRAAGIRTVVVAGLTTNHCVSTTVRMAANLGFETYVAADATAAFDRIGLDGAMRPAAAVHAAALSDLSDEFATILTTDQLLAALAAGTASNRSDRDR